jgi:hypothetical protein
MLTMQRAMSGLKRENPDAGLTRLNHSVGEKVLALLPVFKEEKEDPLPDRLLRKMKQAARRQQLAYFTLKEEEIPAFLDTEGKLAFVLVLTAAPCQQETLTERARELGQQFRRPFAVTAGADTRLLYHDLAAGTQRPFGMLNLMRRYGDAACLGILPLASEAKRKELLRWTGYADFNCDWIAGPHGTQGVLVYINKLYRGQLLQFMKRMAVRSGEKAFLFVETGGTAFSYRADTGTATAEGSFSADTVESFLRENGRTSFELRGFERGFRMSCTLQNLYFANMTSQFMERYTDWDTQMEKALLKENLEPVSILQLFEKK